MTKFGGGEAAEKGGEAEVALAKSLISFGGEEAEKAV